MGDINVEDLLPDTNLPNTGGCNQHEGDPNESNLQFTDPAPTSSGDIYDPEHILPPTIVSVNTPRDPNTSSNFGLLPSDARGDMSNSSIPRHAKSRHSRSHHNNAQKRSAPHCTHPNAPTVAPHENTQHRPPTSFPAPSLHFSTSPSPHGHGGAYIGQYTMSPQPTPIGAILSPPPYGFSHTYHHPMVPDSNIIPQNIHTHYQSLSQHPHTGPVYHYQRHSQEGNSTPHSSFLTPIFPTHQTNALGPPPSPHPTPPSSQNSPISPSYIGPGTFHSLQYSSPMSTPHYTYSPPFSGTPPYQSQYPLSQFGQRYTVSSRDSEPHGDWYYVPRPGPVPAPSQQYEAGPSYSGHYPAPYPLMRPELNNAYSATSFSSTSSSTSYPTPPILPLSQQAETLSSDIFRRGVAHTASLSSGSEHPPSDKPIVRRSYHPNPPQHRSEWVMWAGNIPSDASHDEIYRFFSQVPEDRASEPAASMGVVSVFLISRSNCAFVNFESEGSLLEAISRFNGISLRADDTRCARLVCRIRRKDDDLKAGVGGQRGAGMHTRWVDEQKQNAREKKTKHDHSDLPTSDHSSTPPLSISEHLANGMSNISFSGDDSELGRNLHSSTSGSFSSSNSSFLGQHFPKRYFILKSLTQHDLDLSVQTGFWATQKHNEGILDQSYRTSQDVYLIFGVNKSGEFYGYARMAGPVRRGEQNIPWAPSPPRSHQSPISGRLSSQSSDPTFFSPGDHRLVDNSPLPVDGLRVKTASADLRPGQEQEHLPNKLPQSAPGMIGLKYDLPSMKTLQTKYSLDQYQTRFMKNQACMQNDDFELDPSAPVRAMRSTGGMSGSRGTSLQSLEKVEERAEELENDAEEPNSRLLHEQEVKNQEEDSWGDCFAVEWVSTEKLSFNRTKHLRNPWNHDREVKVSRDGTELEPTVGQKLLDEWHQFSGLQQQQSSAGGGAVGARADGYGGGSNLSLKRLAPRSTTTTSAHRLAREGKDGENAG